jgi:hypothetical protein
MDGCFERHIMFYQLDFRPATLQGCLDISDGLMLLGQRLRSVTSSVFSLTLDLLPWTFLDNT